MQAVKVFSTCASSGPRHDLSGRTTGQRGGSLVAELLAINSRLHSLTRNTVHPVLENNAFLTAMPEFQKFNLYWVSGWAILGRFSNTVAGAMWRSTSLSVGSIITRSCRRDSALWRQRMPTPKWSTIRKLEVADKFSVTRHPTCGYRPVSGV